MHLIRFLCRLPTVSHGDITGISRKAWPKAMFIVALVVVVERALLARLLRRPYNLR